MTAADVLELAAPQMTAYVDVANWASSSRAHGVYAGQKKD